MEFIKLKDVCEFINGDRGKNYPKSTEYEDEGIPFINAGHISNNRIDFSEMNYISEGVYRKLGSGKTQNGDILFCLRGSLGKNAFIDFEMGAIASSLVIIRNKDKNRLNTLFLMYILNSQIIYSQINKANNGSSQPNLSSKSLSNFIIPLPKINVQNKIVQVLDLAQKLINKRKAQIEALDQLTQSVFLDMFGDPFTNPKGWDVCTFRDVSTVRQGLQIPIAKRLKHKVENSFKYITVQYLNGHKEEEYIQNPKSNVICTKDDILMTRTGNTGMVISNVEGVFHNNFFLIDFNRDLLQKVFLIYYLNNEYIQWDLLRRAGNSTIPDLNHSEFYKISVYMPPLKLQNLFADKIQRIEHQKQVLKLGLSGLEDMYNSILQRAIKGELSTKEKLSTV